MHNWVLIRSLSFLSHMYVPFTKSALPEKAPIATLYVELGYLNELFKLSYTARNAASVLLY